MGTKVIKVRRAKRKARPSKTWVDDIEKTKLDPIREEAYEEKLSMIFGKGRIARWTVVTRIICQEEN